MSAYCHMSPEVEMRTRESQRYSRGGLRDVGRGNADPPARLLRRRIAQADVAAGLDHHPRDAVLASTAIASSTAYPLAIPPRSKRMFGLSSSTVCRSRVEPNEPVADPRQGLLERFGRGEFFCLPGAAPEVDHRADRDIERPLAIARKAPGRGPAPATGRR